MGTWRDGKLGESNPRLLQVIVANSELVHLEGHVALCGVWF